MNSSTVLVIVFLVVVLVIVAILAVVVLSAVPGGEAPRSAGVEAIVRIVRSALRVLGRNQPP